MPKRTARMLTVPASLTLLCAFGTRPPKWASLPAPKPAPVAAALPARSPVPKIVAVNKRIARRVNALRPSFKKRLLRVVHRLPGHVTLLVTSAARTRAEQAALRSTFGVKARPGMSCHEDGRAIDVNVLVNGKRISPRMNQKVIGPLMASEGFVYLGRRDPVHYSLPKSEMDPALTSGPDMDVLTWDELRELKTVGAQPQVAETPTQAAPTTPGPEASAGFNPLDFRP